MTGTVAYILARKIALGAVSGIANITFNDATSQIIFQFNDGTQSGLYVPVPKDGIDGISIINVEIDENNHLICTMSDDSTIDAGEISGGKGGGVVVARDITKFPVEGEEDILYLATSSDTLYYYDIKSNKYRPLVGGEPGEAIDFKTDNIEFDGTTVTFELPVDNKKMNVYVNGIYLTENEDYTVDRTVTPNTITFLETWEESDLCTLTWIIGTINEDNSSSGGECNCPTIDASFATEEDINNLFKDMPKPTPGEGGVLGDASLATKEDIDELFKDTPEYNPGEGGGPLGSATLASKEDIDKLFNTLDSVPTPEPDTIRLATKLDIDNLFK